GVGGDRGGDGGGGGAGAAGAGADSAGGPVRDGLGAADDGEGGPVAGVDAEGEVVGVVVAGPAVAGEDAEAAGAERGLGDEVGPLGLLAGGQRERGAAGRVPRDGGDEVVADGETLGDRRVVRGRRLGDRHGGEAAGLDAVCADQRD